MDINENTTTGGLFKSFLEDLQSELEGRQKERKKELGMVSDQLLDAFLDMQEERQQLQDAIELRQMQLEREIQRRVFREFEADALVLEQKSKHLWDHVYDELDLDSSKKYSLNRKTGIVSEKIHTNL